MIKKFIGTLWLCLSITFLQAQNDPGLLSLDRIYSREFRTGYLGPFQWFEQGDAYTKLERSAGDGGQDIMRYDSRTGEVSLLISAAQLVPDGSTNPLAIADYDWSADQNNLLIFTNTQRVWRTNTRGDYWVYTRDKSRLFQL